MSADLSPRFREHWIHVRGLLFNLWAAGHPPAVMGLELPGVCIAREVVGHPRALCVWCILKHRPSEA